MTVRTDVETIFVRLLDEGTDVMRPVFALPLSGQVYQLLEMDDYDPADETWEFLPRSRVRCEERESGAETFLVAVEQVVIEV